MTGPISQQLEPSTEVLRLQHEERVHRWTRARDLLGLAVVLVGGLHGVRLAEASIARDAARNEIRMLELRELEHGLTKLSRQAELNAIDERARDREHQAVEAERRTDLAQAEESRTRARVESLQAEEVELEGRVRGLRSRSASMSHARPARRAPLDDPTMSFPGLMQGGPNGPR